jgi:hypothetical protein
MYSLWVYDYFLTFGDEVRRPSISRPKPQLLTVVQINYVWSGRKSWSAFYPSRLISDISHRFPAVFALIIAVRYSGNTPSCDGFDSATEQVHSDVTCNLQNYHHVSFHKARKSQPAMRPRYHVHETSRSCAFPPTSHPPPQILTPFRYSTAVMLLCGKSSFIRPPSCFSLKSRLR